jgi:PBSX family phage terminase large subunit
MVAAVADVLAESEPIALFPRQERFVLDDRHYPGYVGGIGSGKTFAGAIKAVRRIAQGPGLGLIVSPTYDLLRLTTQLTTFEILDQLGLPFEYNKSERMCYFRNGAKVAFRTGEKPENLRGPNVRWVWVDEASLMPEELWRIVIGRARIGDDYQVWATFTPKGRNWCQHVWEETATGDETDPLRPLYRIASRENPTLPEGWIESLGYEGRYAEQELEGQFVAFEGMVYDMFDRSVHVKELANSADLTATMAVDIGTRNPTAILTLRGEPEAYHLEHEVYRSGMDTTIILDSVEEEWRRCGARKVYFDPSALAYIESAKRRGIPAEKANNDIIFGIQAVSAELAAGMTIDPSCVNTIAEMLSYHYPEGAKADRARDVPAKVGDHAMDSLRYAIASRKVRPRPRIY